MRYLLIVLTTCSLFACKPHDSRPTKERVGIEEVLHTELLGGGSYFGELVEAEKTGNEILIHEAENKLSERISREMPKPISFTSQVSRITPLGIEIGITFYGRDSWPHIELTAEESNATTTIGDKPSIRGKTAGTYGLLLPAPLSQLKTITKFDLVNVSGTALLSCSKSRGRLWYKINLAELKFAVPH